MQGRRAGSVHELQAAEYIRNQFIEFGLAPGVSGFLQPFPVMGGKFPVGEACSDSPSQSGDATLVSQNVIGTLPGQGELAGQWVVISAHYDHLGCSDTNGEVLVFNGADDNASGTAALLELARVLGSGDLTSGRGRRLSAGQEVTCTFENEKFGKIKIIKVTPPDSDQGFFTFAITGGITQIPDNVNTFPTDLIVDSKDPDGPMTPLFLVEAATDYMVQETVAPVQWIIDPNNLPECRIDNVLITTTFDGTDKLSGVEVEPGKTTECTYTNLPPGKLTIFKLVEPFPDTEQFGFSLGGFSSGNIDTFFLDDDFGVFGGDGQDDNASIQYLLSADDLYTVLETLPDQTWELVNISCIFIGTDHGTTINEQEILRKVDILFAAGDEIECTFTNQSDFPGRTQGYWKTHTENTKLVFDWIMTVDGPIVMGASAPVKTIDTYAKLFGAWVTNTSVLCHWVFRHSSF